MAQRTLATLDSISPLYPDDVYLQAVRGYTHKNCAIALLDFGRDREASEELKTADQVFTTLLDEYPDPNTALANPTGTTSFSNYSPFGRSGRFVYGRMSYKF